MPAKTPKELVAWLKANPDKAQFGSPGAGALPHFFGLMFGKAAGIEMTHIAYKGGTPAIADLLGGQIPMVSSTASEFLDLHQAGKLRVIATSDVERSLGFPDVPTFKESGYRYRRNELVRDVRPGEAPDDVVVRLNKAIVAAVKSPDVAQRLIGFGLNPTGTSPASSGRIQKADAALWEPVIKASGFRTSAADLTSLQRLPHARSGTSNRKAALDRISASALCFRSSCQRIPHV